MGIHEDILGTIVDQVGQEFDVRTGRTVPTDETITSGQAVELEATYLYADLADSSGLAQKVDPHDAARVIRAYVNTAVKLIRHKDGHIRSFDGDRVMGIFVGDDKETRAGRTALAINAYVVAMRGWIPGELPSVKEAGWKMRHGVGIDTGPALIIRAGIRDNADIVSIGQAPNVAAKLSDIRDGHALHATEEAYVPMSREVSFKGSALKPEEAKSRWPHRETVTVGGRTISVRGSSWYWDYG
ncbi:adenylate/guanylate cyclase domain-containing protein [Modestobacter sp. I12A-02628]|uniref:Adenylate/guanylate cyclase domain-containing protein n=1 Tax=Goekera deserti TaxID=2497753 RepID=A0A7K3WDI6_9ACTN|nr:adenylate/guanylate cyclase domain-containing protein [Goekera deserti]MPQ96868.1 adenylate/guanylate cyclase domain-containing protein [Goekera deserti]NDI46818.1 adenylate/guanylate cyclase domain-containing protein [Goekera deserti]NEL54386.1 adenylate/guanylate cyclase domain-containing protein [Goekera deserti]